MWQAVEMSPSQKLKSLTDVKTATFSTAEKIPIIKISKILSGLKFTASMPHKIPNNRSPIADSIERDVRVDIKLFFGKFIKRGKGKAEWKLF